MLQIIDWNEFLNEFNQYFKKELLEIDYYDEELENLKKGNWLGQDGATEAQIKSIEERLNCKLPPSYKNFLKASNGWDYLGSVIRQLLPVEKIEWFSVRNQYWIDAYVQPMEENLGPIESWKKPSVADEEYFAYGFGQGYCRVEYLQTALEISEIGDSAIVLLNPKVINQDGEWETWEFVNWYPGAARYRSFSEYMIAVYYNILNYYEAK